MKHTLLFILYFLSFSPLFADIAPNPIMIHGIYTVNDCKIQMVSEYVFADLYNDSAKVECTFNLLNFGDATEIQIGFPEMNFQYWSIGEYSPTDKGIFKIYVDGKLLNENDIKVPAQMENIYQKYMSVYYFSINTTNRQITIFINCGEKLQC